jgi:NADH-quinone oxidoreductase subunit M
MSGALSILLLLPLIGLFLLALARLGKQRAAQHLWIVAAGVGTAQLAVALAVHAGFDVAASRLDGSDGFQFVERAVLLRTVGIEYALGVDGLSVGLVVVSAFALVAVAVFSRSSEGTLERHWVLLLLADLGAVGALVAIDLALILAFWGLALLATTLMVRGSGEDGARRVAVRFAVPSAIAYALVAAAVVLIANQPGPARTFSIPALARTDLVGPARTIAQIPAIKLIYGALFLGLGALMGLAPLHAWLAGTIARVPAATALLVNVAVSGVASYLFLRIGYGVLPAGTAWAAPLLGGVGALSVVWCALAAAAEHDLKRLTAAAGAVNVGIVLLALSSLTAIGVEGAVAAIQSQLLYSVLALGLGARLEASLRSTDLGRARALWAAAPTVGLVAWLAWVAQVGAPGSYAFVARLLAIVGAFPLRPLAASAALAGLVIFFFSHARLAKKVLNARAEREESRAAAVSRPPFGTLASAIVVLAAFSVVLLGFWPKPALSAISSSALDHAARVNPPGPLEIVHSPENQRGDGLARALPSFCRDPSSACRLSDSRSRPLFATCVQAKP